MRLGQRMSFIGLCFLCSSALGNDLSHGLVVGEATAVSDASVSIEISPEGVRELIKNSVAFILIDADDAGDASVRVGEGVRSVYYTRGPSFRSAYERVSKDRRSSVQKPGGARGLSQRLVGTPLEWARLALPLPSNLVPERPLTLTAKQLSESLKDGADLQIVDLRPRISTGMLPFPKSMSLMPHELVEMPTTFSKERWLVLVDDDGLTSPPIAEHLFLQGYPLVTTLVGGYVEWVKFTGR